MTSVRSAPLAPRASAHLDMLRGLSAVVVVIGHVRGMFFTDLEAIGGWKASSAALKVVYGVTSLGHQAVMVFFVLSGFLVGGSVLNSIDRWSWKPYVVNRLTRLYAVLVPALLLTAVTDYVAHGLPHGPLYYEHAIAHFNDQPYLSRTNPLTFLGNLVFLQTVLVSPFGSNSPLWSLANEAWYYAMFPLGVVAIAGRVGGKQRSLCGMLLASCVLWLPVDLTAAFGIWLFGVAVHRLPAIDASSRPKTAWLLVATTGLSVIGVLVLVKLGRISVSGGDFAVGLCAAALLYCIVRIQWARLHVSHGYAATAATLSRCSYSVYAVHFPLVMLVRSALPIGTWAPTVLNLLAGAAMTAGLFLCGFLFSTLTEARTDLLRRRISKWFDRRQPEPVAAAG